MRNLNSRVRRLEVGLSPKAAALRAVMEILQCGSNVAYCNKFVGEAYTQTPWRRAVEDAEQAIKESMKGDEPWFVSAACRKGRREILFLASLFDTVNDDLILHLMDKHVILSCVLQAHLAIRRSATLSSLMRTRVTGGQTCAPAISKGD